MALQILALFACAPAQMVATPPGGDSDDTELTEDSEALPPWPALVVNELMSNSEGSYVDAAGQPVDWVELYNPTAEDVDLEGWSVSDDWTDKRLHVFGPGLVVPAGGHLVLEAAAAEAPVEGAVLSFSLNAGGESVGLFGPDGRSVDWLGFPRQAGDQARARLPDGGETWVEMPVGTPGAPNARLESQELLVVSAGATWLYQDRGRDLGESWREVSFGDGAWESGAAPLGYGDDLATTVDSGNSDGSGNNPTTYFRHRFTVDAAAIAGAYGGEVALQVDDGAIVWLNGQEVGRVRMPDGDVSYEDWAASVASGDAETLFNSLPFSAALLQEGEQVIAVEVHQANSSSSDIRLDLELLVQSLVVAQ